MIQRYPDRFWCEYALIDDPASAIRQGVAIETSDGRISSIADCATPPPNVAVLNGLTIPGLANAHSHAFHRVLRGRTHGHSNPGRSGPRKNAPDKSTQDKSTQDKSTFWTWRSQMYQVAAKLDPSNYQRLARAVFGEMALAGITVVGEFHYVHHQPNGDPYVDSNAMGLAVLAAAAEVGLRITLLDACYLHGGIGADGHYPVAEEQQRFSDRSVERWISRMGLLSETALERTARLGAAIHSVRAMSVEEMRSLALYTAEQDMPVHVHLSETLVEDAQSVSSFGARPAELLQRAAAPTNRLTAVHATHATQADIAILAEAKSSVCFCPTTERDLADGIGPSLAMTQAGVPLCVGSDSNAMIDLFEEVRAVELHERLLGHERANHSVAALMTMASANGYRSLGWDDAGQIGVGQLADFVSIRLNSVRTAGTSPARALASVLYAASPADVDTVVVDGQAVVRGHRHRSLDVANELSQTIAELAPGV